MCVIEDLVVEMREKRHAYCAAGDKNPRTKTLPRNKIGNVARRSISPSLVDVPHFAAGWTGSWLSIGTGKKGEGRLGNWSETFSRPRLYTHISPLPCLEKQMLKALARKTRNTYTNIHTTWKPQATDYRLVSFFIYFFFVIRFIRYFNNFAFLTVPK